MFITYAYMGYFSVDYIRRTILKQTDSEIGEIDAQIVLEKESGIIPPPVDPTTGLPIGEPQPESPALGDVPMSSEVSTDAVELPPSEKAPELKMPKGGRI